MLIKLQTEAKCAPGRQTVPQTREGGNQTILESGGEKIEEGDPKDDSNRHIRWPRLRRVAEANSRWGRLWEKRRIGGAILLGRMVSTKRFEKNPELKGKDGTKVPLQKGRTARDDQKKPSNGDEQAHN